MLFIENLKSEENCFLTNIYLYMFLCMLVKMCVMVSVIA